MKMHKKEKKKPLLKKKRAEWVAGVCGMWGLLVCVGRDFCRRGVLEVFLSRNNV